MESHGQSSLVSYGPQGRKELDMTEHAHALMYLLKSLQSVQSVQSLSRVLLFATP